MLSQTNKFVFVHVPKTGGNSLQTVLETYSDDRRVRTLGFQNLTDTFDIKGAVTGSKHFTSDQYIDRLGLEAFMSLKKVTFVRHPQDRVMSFYFAPFRWMRPGLHGGGANPTFDKREFLHLLPRIGTATHYLSHRRRLIDFDVIGRFENYAADFNRILQACGVLDAPSTPPHVNRRVADPMVHWDREMLDAVEAQFADDFRHFGYKLRR